MPSAPGARDARGLLDVAVIGAGPAGATAARLLALWGHSVALIGRAPSKRTLAESLPPSCTKLFDQLLIRREIDAAPFVRATGNTVRWGGGETRVEHFPPGTSGYQVSRDAFDAVLVAAATSYRTVAHHEATALDVARAADGTSTITLESATGRSTLRARWVLDCSGRTGVLARHGMRRAEPAARTMAVVGVWDRARDDKWPIEEFTHTLVESYDGGWGWSVPVSASRRFLTFMVDPAITAVPARAGLADAYAAELARTTMLRDIVADGRATLVDAPWGSDASPYSATRTFDDGALLVGDAASFIDPLSSFGVKKALASAWLASVVVHTSLTEAAMTGAALELFDERERAMFEQLQRQSASLSRDAAGAHPTDFWNARSGAVIDDRLGDLDAESLRGDARVLAAFEEIKRRPAVRLRMSPSVTTVQRPSVRGNRVVSEPHLSTPDWPRGVRYCRNVDLVVLSELAPVRDQVPDLYDAYARAASQVPLPDFLGALSALIGLQILTFAD